MHIHKRLVPVSVFLLLFLSLTGYSLVGSLLERQRIDEELRDSIGDASLQYGEGRGLPFLKSQREKELRIVERSLAKIGREKREVRLEIAALREKFDHLRTDYGLDAVALEAMVSVAQKERGRFLSFVRMLGYRYATREWGFSGVQRVLLPLSLGEVTSDALVDRSLGLTRLQLLRALLTAEALRALEERHEEIASVYAAAFVKVQLASERREEVASRIRDVQRTVTEVHAQVLRLQSELSRIDARLRSRAERELIEKGLLEGEPGIHSSGDIASGVALSWPVFGSISAGFLSQGYERFFGVPHWGMDIITPQGTPVFSAEDGIVFLARDGGATGYSYVLIGHRDGFATLYGHLSAVTVSTGEEVLRGQAIGLSGGTPGTYGAGPMTTGAHVHFEVIRSGVHIDPQSVL